MEAARVIDMKTGEVLHDCADCANYERELKAKRRRITFLEGELAEKRRTEAQAKDIIEVLSYWRDRCSKRPDQVRVERTSHPRWGKVRDRLQEDFTVAELKLAVEGALASPFHNGTDPKNDVTKGGRQYLDAETIFMTAKTVESHGKRAESYVEHVGVLPSAVNRALIGLDMATELEFCDCAHHRLFHLAVAETGGREVCGRCGCGGFSSASQPWGSA